MNLNLKQNKLTWDRRSPCYPRTQDSSITCCSTGLSQGLRRALQLTSRGHDLHHLATTYITWPRLTSPGHELHHLATTYITWPRLTSRGHDPHHRATTYFTWPRLTRQGHFLHRRVTTYTTGHCLHHRATTYTSRLSSYLFRLFLFLIAFLLFPCANVFENTRA